jgi:hypothetical protein
MGVHPIHVALWWWGQGDPRHPYSCITDLSQKVIRPTQTTFMPGRHILEGVVVLHETVHELHRKKLDGVLFKIDFVFYAFF